MSRNLSSSLPVSLAALVGAAVLLVAAPASAEEWKKYEAKEYGFSMLVPPGTRWTEKEHPGGWGVLEAEVEGVRLYAIGKLGKPAKADAIEKVGVRVTKVPAKAWKEIDRGKGKGWTWFRTVRADLKGHVLFGGYGAGPKGSYMLVLKTTAADFKKHQKDYQRWYESIRLR